VGDRRYPYFILPDGADKRKWIENGRLISGAPEVGQTPQGFDLVS
jgi:hypothetical protein